MPNLKEQMAQLVEEFDAAETIEEARAIKSRMDEVQNLIKTAGEKKSLLAELESKEDVNVNQNDQRVTDARGQPCTVFHHRQNEKFSNLFTEIGPASAFVRNWGPHFSM